MADKKLTMREVGERIVRDFMGDLDCIFTDHNAEDLVLRLRILKDQGQVGDAEEEGADDEDKDCR